MPAGNIAALIKTSGLRPGVRALTLWKGSAGIERQVAPVLREFAGETIAIDDDPFNVPLPDNVGLCIAAPPTARVRDVLEELLPDRLAASLTAGGLVAVPFCIDANDNALAPLQLPAPVIASLQQFQLAHFARLTTDEISLAERFVGTAFEYIGCASRGNRAGEALVWLVLRRRDTAATAVPFARSDRPDRYPLRDLATFMSALKRENIELLPIDAFAERARLGETVVGHIKLDLHRDIRRPLEVARLLSEQGVPALFLMMPRHPFNAAFFDRDETWDTLRAIRDGGHEIGLHLDVFDAIRVHRDLIKGTTAALDDFARRGFKVRAATLHGDTRPHLLARHLAREDFFAEDAELSRWDGKPPEREEYVAEHVRRYSYRALAELGIRYIVEERFRIDGELVPNAPLAYATDNNRVFQARNLAGGTLHAPAAFRIPQQFAQSCARVLAARPFVALFHPQWFW